jgi:hypothetical protein
MEAPKDASVSLELVIANAHLLSRIRFYAIKMGLRISVLVQSLLNPTGSFGTGSERFDR